MITKKGQNDCVNTRPSIARPATACDRASTFSVDMKRSAICPPTNSPTTAAIACVAKIHAISQPEKRSTSER
jgi:hypothetical protein